MLKELRERDIKLFFCDQGLVDQVNDAGDPTKTLIRQILSALAEWDRAMQVLKLAGARARKRAETGRCEGAKPYGTKPGEAEILATINRFREDGHSWSFICEALNRGALKTRGGQPWTRQNVQSIWKNANPVDNSSEPGH
jgi:DNA invertase Pin-like site-specific DNA recombinase